MEGAETVETKPQRTAMSGMKKMPSGTFPVWKSSGTAVLLVYGIYPVEGIGVFRVPKNGDARNKKPPALRVETKRCTKKSPFRYNRVVQALL